MTTITDMLPQANTELKNKVFQTKLVQIIEETKTETESGLNIFLFRCLKTFPDRFDPYMVNLFEHHLLKGEVNPKDVKKVTKWVNKITLLDVINGFGGERVFAYNYLAYNRRGFYCGLIPWLKEQGLTKKDTFLLFDNPKQVRDVVFAEERATLKKAFESDVATLLASGASACDVIEFFKKDKRFRTKRHLL